MLQGFGTPTPRMRTTAKSAGRGLLAAGLCQEERMDGKRRSAWPCGEALGGGRGYTCGAGGGRPDSRAAWEGVGGRAGEAELLAARGRPVPVAQERPGWRQAERWMLCCAALC